MTYNLKKLQWKFILILTYFSYKHVYTQSTWIVQLVARSLQTGYFGFKSWCLCLRRHIQLTRSVSHEIINWCAIPIRLQLLKGTLVTIQQHTYTSWRRWWEDKCNNCTSDLHVVHSSCYVRRCYKAMHMQQTEQEKNIYIST